MAEDVKPSSTTKDEPPGGGGVAPPFEPPSIAKYSDTHYHFPTDKVVFGVAAVLVLALLVWGLVSTETLSAVATSVLSGVIAAGGWAFVLAASAFVVFAIWLAVSKYGRIPLGRDNETTGVPDRVVGRDDVQRRHGHRTDVLRGRGAAGALHLPPTGHGRGRDADRRSTSRWPPPSSTGRCTPGRSTPSLAWPSPTEPSAAVDAS